MLAFNALDITVLKPIPFKHPLITLHFHNKQATSPLRTLRRHIENWSFSSTPSPQPQKQFVEIRVQFHVTAAFFLPTRSLEGRKDSTAGVIRSEKREGSFLRCKSQNDPSVVQKQPSRLTEWDIAAPLEWRTVPIILLNCWQMAAHYSLSPYHVPCSVWIRSSTFICQTVTLNGKYGLSPPPPPPQQILLYNFFFFKKKKTL